MKAIVHHEYGDPDVLKLVDLEKPVPTEDEVLVRVYASSVNPAEWHAMTGLWLVRMASGWRKPKDVRLGADFAGVVDAVGSNFKRLKPGDEVFGGRHGAFAEYVTVGKSVVLKPSNISFEQAGSVATAGLTALQGLRDYGKVQAGQKVLINGAAGGVGTFAVQIAKALGAEVTGVCSMKNVEMVRKLGADHVVDYTKEDFTRGDRRYDLLFDVAGGRSWHECKRVLKPDATFVIVGGPKTDRIIGPLRHVLRILIGSRFSSQNVKFFIANFNVPDFEALNKLIESGEVSPIVERTYPLSETAEAMRYLGTSHAKAKLVITMDQPKKK